MRVIVARSRRRRFEHGEHAQRDDPQPPQQSGERTTDLMRAQPPDDLAGEDQQPGHEEDPPPPRRPQLGGPLRLEAVPGPVRRGGAQVRLRRTTGRCPPRHGSAPPRRNVSPCRAISSSHASATAPDSAGSAADPQVEAPERGQPVGSSSSTGTSGSCSRTSAGSASRSPIGAPRPAPPARRGAAARGRRPPTRRPRTVSPGTAGACSAAVGVGHLGCTAELGHVVLPRSSGGRCHPGAAGAVLAPRSGEHQVTGRGASCTIGAMEAAADYQYAPLRIPPGTSRAAAATLLSMQSESGGWELAPPATARRRHPQGHPAPPRPALLPARARSSRSGRRSGPVRRAVERRPVAGSTRRPARASTCGWVRNRRAGQVGAAQVGVAQVGARAGRRRRRSASAQVRADQVGAAQARAAQVGARAGGADQVGAPAVRRPLRHPRAHQLAHPAAAGRRRAAGAPATSRAASSSGPSRR